MKEPLGLVGERQLVSRMGIHFSFQQRGIAWIGTVHRVLGFRGYGGGFSRLLACYRGDLFHAFHILHVTYSIQSPYSLSIPLVRVSL